MKSREEREKDSVKSLRTAIPEFDRIDTPFTSETPRALLCIPHSTHFVKGTSETRSLPPASFPTLSAKNTLPVVLIATMWECSLRVLNEIGSCSCPFAFLA